jgi:hypothetical protein
MSEKLMESDVFFAIIGDPINRGSTGATEI